MVVPMALKHSGSEAEQAREAEQTVVMAASKKMGSGT